MIKYFSLVMLIPFLAAGEPANKCSKYKSFIDSLTSVTIKYSYSCDGAADGTVLIIGANNLGIVDSPLTPLLNIVNLKEQAFPLLIEHLDDVRPSSAIFNCNGKMQTVLVGYICYDILVGILKGTGLQISIPDCPDDGLCACMQDGYCFRPDDYIIDQGVIKVEPIVNTVKMNFQKAFENKGLTFIYPNWWRKPKRIR